MSYEKFYPNGWQSGETGGTPITPEALNHIENGIKQTYKDFAPAVQSAEHPGCYYRTVNGVVEWINPPMVPGEEYRTTERWEGKAVWTVVVNCKKLPNAAQTQTPHGFSATKIIRYAGTTDEGYALPYLSGGNYVDIAVTPTTIYITTSADYSSATAYVQLWYTKD